jgi:plasmid stabilization system protein ParE
MPQTTFHMTATARNHLKKAVRDTKRIWGARQARKYNTDFLDGLQHLANNHHTFHAHHRAEMANGTDFCLDLIEHRYVAFQVHNENTIIIAGIFHEKMDIPTRLKELQRMAQHEIEALKRALESI